MYVRISYVIFFILLLLLLLLFVAVIIIIFQILYCVVLQVLRMHKSMPMNSNGRVNDVCILFVLLCVFFLIFFYFFFLLFFAKFDHVCDFIFFLSSSSSSTSLLWICDCCSCWQNFSQNSFHRQIDKVIYTELAKRVLQVIDGD